jgi:hypothetical protein
MLSVRRSDLVCQKATPGSLELSGPDSDHHQAQRSHRARRLVTASRGRVDRLVSTLARRLKARSDLALSMGDLGSSLQARAGGDVLR